MQYQISYGNRDGEIIYIYGHKWQIVDTRFTLPGRPTYKIEDVIRAGGHTPYPFATNLKEE